MSTRGFVGFVVDGEEKITYNHSDSYLSGVGAEVLGFLLDCEGDYLAVHALAKMLRVVDGDSRPTPEDIANLNWFADKSVSTGDLDEWYVLLRNTQGDLGKILQAGVIVDGRDFPKDSLFAEFGYIVDFDQQVFQVYRGFQKEVPTKGRWAGVEEPIGEEQTRTRGDGSTYTYRTNSMGYQPCTLWHEWPLDALPSPEYFCTLGSRVRDPHHRDSERVALIHESRRRRRVVVDIPIDVPEDEYDQWLYENVDEDDGEIIESPSGGWTYESHTILWDEDDE